MNSLKTWAVVLITALLLILVGVLISYIPLKSHFKAQIEAFEPKVEQVIIRDTIVKNKPLLVEKKIIDTIVVFDTLISRDTIYLPIEQKIYEDSSYRAWVSGYNPNLDSIKIYNKTIEITKISTQKEWRKFTYGVQVGVGLVCPFNTAPTFGGYIGFGIGYNF